MSLLHNHLEKGARIQIHLLVLPPEVKTPTVGMPGRGPACYYRFPISFRMATHVSPTPCSTVIWFGNLEFMYTGFGYDMILHSIKGPGGARVMFTRSKAQRWPRHHASPPKRRHGQHRHHPTAVARSSPRAGRATVEEPTAPRTETIVMTARHQNGRATASGAAYPTHPRLHLHYCHTVCSARRGCSYLGWTTPRHRSPG